MLEIAHFDAHARLDLQHAIGVAEQFPVAFLAQRNSEIAAHAQTGEIIAGRLPVMRGFAQFGQLADDLLLADAFRADQRFWWQAKLLLGGAEEAVTRPKIDTHAPLKRW